MPTITKHYTFSMATLEAMRSPTFTPFHCAHHWVSDESIRAAMLLGKWDDPAVPWTEKTNRAARIGSIVTLMLNRVRFPSLYAHFHAGASLNHPSHVVEHNRLELADGHHRLRALQFLGRTDAIRVNVSGPWQLFDTLLMRQKAAEQRQRFERLMGPYWTQHEHLVKQGYTLVESLHDELVYRAPLGSLTPSLESLEKVTAQLFMHQTK